MNDYYLLKFNKYQDIRGCLVPFEYKQNCPFEIKRVFYIYNVPEINITRAEHINKISKQILICLRGNCCVYVQSGSKNQEFILNSPDTGLFINNGVYKKLYNFSKDALLLCLCDNYYNIEDYDNIER